MHNPFETEQSTSEEDFKYINELLIELDKKEEIISKLRGAIENFLKDEQATPTSPDYFDDTDLLIKHLQIFKQVLKDN